MTTQILHNPRCSKSRQTLKLLEDNNQEIEIIEYLKTPPTATELSHIINMLKISPRELLRKGEKEYKEANLADSNLTDSQIIDAMVAWPKLIERPIVIKNGRAEIGRPPEKVLDIL